MSKLLERLAEDLTQRFGRENLRVMRHFYVTYQGAEISQSVIGKSSGLTRLASEAPITRFPLSWTHYIRLLAVRNKNARDFYEAEALRGGWTVRQLTRRSTASSTSAHCFRAIRPRCLREGRGASRPTP